MLPRNVERTGLPGRRGKLPKWSGILRVGLIICLSTVLAACALGQVARDSAAATDIREHMTSDDHHIAAVAVQIAMERRSDNEASTWTNGLSGNHGAVVPRRTYRTQAGAYCRQYEDIVTVAGVAVSTERTACRDGSGRWTTLT